MEKLNTLNKTLHKTELIRLKSNLEEIIIYIYRFRYLNRPQLQKLLNHKYRSYILEWLNKLSEQKYLKKYYNPQFAGEPSYYSLGTVGRKYLMRFASELKDINISELDRVWREGGYSEPFHKHTMFLGYIYLALIELVAKVDEGQGKLKFFTQTDLKGVEYLINREPDAYFFIEDKNKKSKRYFLEMVQEHARWKDIQSKVGKYFTYFKKKIWQDNMKTEFPELIIVCSNYHQKNGINRHLLEQFKRRRLELPFYLTTKIEIKSQGMNGQILHKVE